MVGTVILNYNNSAQTLACLESLHAHCKGGNYKVCVVDNASCPAELEKLRSGCREKILVAEENGGYARGNNLGCKYFDKDPDVDAILILNDDTRFTQDIISPLYDYLKGHVGCGVVFPLVLAPDGSVDRACLRRQKSLGDLVLQATSLGRIKALQRRSTTAGRGEFLPLECLEGKHEVVTEVPPGSCMMLPKSVFRRIGWFDPNTVLYFEEHIISEKLKRECLSCVLLPGISIVHFGAQTTARQSSSAVYSHWRGSYLYFLKEYAGAPGWLRKLLTLRTAAAKRFK